MVSEVPALCQAGMVGAFIFEVKPCAWQSELVPERDKGAGLVYKKCLVLKMVCHGFSWEPRHHQWSMRYSLHAEAACPLQDCLSASWLR